MKSISKKRNPWKYRFFKTSFKFKRFFSAELKETYLSLSIGTMIVTLLSFHYGIVLQYFGSSLLVSIILSYILLKMYCDLNKWFGKEIKYILIWMPIYAFFLYYSIIFQTYQVANFINLEYGVLENSFSNVINYIAIMVSLQNTSIAVLFPLALLLFIKGNAFVKKFKWESFLVIVVVYSILIFIFVNVLAKRNTAFFKSYQYWVDVHSFVNIVHCDGKNYPYIKSHRISDKEYIWRNRNTKPIKEYNKLINKDICENKKYCRVTCDQINKMQSYIDNVNSKVDISLFP